MTTYFLNSLSLCIFILHEYGFPLKPKLVGKNDVDVDVVDGYQFLIAVHITRT